MKSKQVSVWGSLFKFERSHHEKEGTQFCCFVNYGDAGAWCLVRPPPVKPNYILCKGLRDGYAKGGFGIGKDRDGGIKRWEEVTRNDNNPKKIRGGLGPGLRIGVCSPAARRRRSTASRVGDDETTPSLRRTISTCLELLEFGKR
ncbi:hypothetical protein L1887_18661 [Cichorium endivia]|nr:hypothetical protein L1887_18661 [Cichorium endivia]